MQPDFSIPAGDNPSITGTVTGYNSIAGYTITFAAKKNVDDTTPIFSVVASIINPTAGTISFPLTSAMTQQPENLYYYDIKVADGSGNILHTKRSIFQITKAIA